MFTETVWKLIHTKFPRCLEATLQESIFNELTALHDPPNAHPHDARILELNIW